MACLKYTGKCFLSLVNAIFLVLASVLIGLGTWIMLTDTYRNNVLLFVAHFVRGIPISLVVLGSVAALIALLGFWGAIFNKSWMLKLYALILLIILLLHVCGVLYIGILVSYRTENISAEVRQPFEDYNTNSHDAHFVDSIQGIFECCGFDNYQSMKRNGSYPVSCCDTETLLDICIGPDYTTGCWDMFNYLFIKVGIVYGAFTGFQILCIAFAIYLSTVVSKRAGATPPYFRRL